MYLSSLILLIMGMGTTFIFLYVMILCTRLNSKLAPAFSNLIPEPEVKGASKPKAVVTDDTAIVAAIAAAMVKAN